MSFRTAKVAPEKADFRPALPLCFSSGIAEIQMAKTYFEKLKDPRWQKKRLEVLDKAEFRCALCGDDSQTLHVHHKQYFKGREPWEYEVGQLAALCETCHKEGHLEEDPLLIAASFAELDGPYSRQTVASLVAGYCGHGMEADHARADPDSYLAGEIARRLFSWDLDALTTIEKLKLVRLSEADLSGITTCLKAYIASKG